MGHCKWVHMREELIQCGVAQNDSLTTPAAVQVGVWMLYSTWGLVVAIRERRVEEHPMFNYADDDLDHWEATSSKEIPGGSQV